MSEVQAWLRGHAPILVALLVGLVAGGGTIALTDDSDGDGPNPPQTVTTVKIPKAGNPASGKAKAAVPAEVPKAQVRATKDGELGQHADARDQTPPGVTSAQVAKSQAKQDEIRASQPALPTAGASAGFQGCVSRFVVNQSSRRGVRPQLQVLHYTVSPNVAGWGDVNAVVGLFNRPSFSASSNFVIDGEGHCAYIVPIEAKSWTQAAANPYAVSYEVINTGRESTYIGAPGLAKLRSVMRQVAARTGIPLRRGAVNSCIPTRTGIIQHKDLGLCGGGHTDIAPYSVEGVIRAVASGAATASAASRSSKAERRIVARRCYHHRKRFARGASKATRVKQLRYSRQWKAAAGRQKRRLDAAHRRGQSWKTDSIGTRRKVMARTERFAKGDRRALCR